ncbi:MAG: hypothetical protein ACKO3W_06330 [bacterium]
MARAQAPAEAQAIDAFLAVRGWLDRDALPALDAVDARVDLPSTAAVAVLLRVDGRVVGRGEDATGDPFMVRRAAGRAVTEALGDTTIRAVRAELGDRVTARLSLEIELAGPVRPLLGRTVAEAAARVVPGAEGIALLKGDEVFRAFPSRLLANDSADRPDTTIAGLMRAAGLPAKDLRDFGPSDRVSLARFDTVRLRQGAPDASPSVVVRGGRRIELDEITPGSIRILATQLAARLAGQVLPLSNRSTTDVVDAAATPLRRWGLLGTYNPTADTYEPPFAGSRDEAFAAFALAHASRCAALPAPTRARAAESAVRLAETLLVRDTNERTDAGDAMTLLVLRTLAEAPTRPAHIDLEQRVRTSAQATLTSLTARKPDGATSTPDAATVESTTLESTTLETASIAAAALTAPGATHEDHALAGALVDALLSRTESSRGRLADGMLLLGSAARSNALPEATRAALNTVLVELATVLDTLQLMPAVPSNEPIGANDASAQTATDVSSDLVGGFALPGTRAVMADAQGLRLAAAIALLRRSSVTTGPLEPRLKASVRFLAQHVADEPWTDGFRRPEALRGMVRASLASDDCPPAATAAGLLLAIAALPADSN